MLENVVAYMERIAFQKLNVIRNTVYYLSNIICNGAK